MAEPDPPLLTIRLDDEVLASVGPADPPCTFELSRKVGSDSKLVFSGGGGDHVHRFGELSGWARFSFRVLDQNILRADCFITEDESPDPDAVWRGHGSGVRFQPLTLEGCPVPRSELVGAGAFVRGLHDRGLITPGWYRLAVECDACAKSFQLQPFHAGMMDVEYMYSESGLHTLVIRPGETEDLPDLSAMTDEVRREFEEEMLPFAPDGTRFSYYNALRCPHCRAPFFDYGKYPEDRKEDYYGHSHIGSDDVYWTLGDAPPAAGADSTAPALPTSDGEAMVFEARYHAGVQYVGIGGVAVLSLLGFVMVGIIPTESTRNYGTYPILGWSWLAGCASLIAILLGRARDQRPRLRIDADGLWVRGLTEGPIPWSEITGTNVYRMPRGGYVLRVALRDPAILKRGPLKSAYAALDKRLSGGDFGINPRNWDRGLPDLVEAIAFFRPDLAPR